MTIHIDDDLNARIATAARNRGIEFEDCAIQALEFGLQYLPAPNPAQVDLDEFERLVRNHAEGCHDWAMHNEKAKAASERATKAMSDIEAIKKRAAGGTAGAVTAATAAADAAIKEYRAASKKATGHEDL